MATPSFKVGFVGFGEVNTPREFIDPRCKAAADRLRAAGFDLFETAPVSDDPKGEQADRAVAELRAACIDALVVCVAGWIPSWAVLRVIEPFKGLPMLLWGQSGWRANGHFVTTADQAGTTALRAPLAAQGFRFKYLVDFKDSPTRSDEAAAWLAAARADFLLHHQTIGFCGYRDMKLYGTLYHGNLLKARVGCEIEHFDLLELVQIQQQIPLAVVAAGTENLKSKWAFVRDPQPGTVENSVRLAIAIERKICSRGYSAFSFCDVDGIKALLHFAPAGALAYLHERLAIPTVPENDSYGAVTECLMRALTDEVPMYMEFYEFTKDTALMGVPDYVPGSWVDGKVTVMPNAFGSFGEGLLNVSRLKTGPVTLARLGEDEDGALAIHAVTADARTPETWEEAGWAPPAPQLPTLEMHFGRPSDDFLEHVAGQHYIVSSGNRLPLLREYCRITGIRFIH